MKGNVKIENVDMDYYNNIINLLKANNNYLIHARTYETILATSHMEKQKPTFATKTITVFDSKTNLELKVKFNRKVALVTPAQSYHRRKNQQVKRGYRFIVKPTEQRKSPLEVQHLKITAQRYDKFNQEWKPIDASKVKYRKTAQYKTVWFTRRSRRK